MSDFDSLREDFAGAFQAINDYAQAQRKHAEMVTAEVERLWDDNAALRDDVHALANRLEALTSFVVADPAEVAQKIVTLREAPDAVEVDKHGKPLTPFAANLRRFSQESKRRPADEVNDA